MNVKEEELEVKEEAVEVKQEVIETEESGSTSRRGEKRALSRSRSPEAAPDAKKQRPEVEEVRVEDEPEVDKTVVALDWCKCFLSLCGVLVRCRVVVETTGFAAGGHSIQATNKSMRYLNSSVNV